MVPLPRISQETSLQRSAESMAGEQQVAVGSQVGSLLNEYRHFARSLTLMLKATKQHAEDMKVGPSLAVAFVVVVFCCC